MSGLIGCERSSAALRGLRGCSKPGRLNLQGRRRLQSTAVPPPIAQGQIPEEELARHVEAGRKAMVDMGYHGESTWVQSVCWGDHDQFQHVNNVHYVRFIESNRMLFAQKLAEKLPLERRNDILRGTGQSFILQSIAVRYRRPVVYPDTLLVGKKPVLPLGEDRFTIQCGLYSLSQRAIVCTAEEISVTYDYRTLSKIPIPDDFRLALEEVGKNPGS